MSLFKRIADHADPRSLAARMRQGRFALFAQLLNRVSGEIRVLDVGGTPVFWDRSVGVARERLRLTVLNQTVPATTDDPLIRVVQGDARDMHAFRDGEFDAVFSNSVIEHVGTYTDQQRMASEIRRVGRRYFVQTPNKYFPLEPHALVPGFQFLPWRVQAALLLRYDLGWYRKAPSYQSALEQVTAVRLLTGREVCELFPGGHLYRERVLGLTKSFVIYDGWEQP